LGTLGPRLASVSFGACIAFGTRGARQALGAL
jgi:hypothetical protein